MVSRLISFLKSSETGPLGMIAGTVLGQGAIMAAIPVLSRMYSPGEFGEYANYMALFAILSLVVCLRYESAIPLPKGNDDSKILAGLAASLATVVSILIAGGLVTAQVVNPSLFLTDAVMYVLPLSLFAAGLQKILLYLNLRYGTYYLVALMRGGQGLAIVGAQVAGGLMGLSGVGLIQGHAAGIAISTSLVGLKMRSLRFFKRDESRDVGRTRVAEFSDMAYTYRKFPQFSIWADLANSAGTQLPILLFTYMYDAATSGIFFLAQRIGNAPATIVAESLGKAFLTRAVNAMHSDSIALETRRFVRSLFALAVVPYAALVLILPQILGWILGAEWDLAGRYLLLLSPWLLSVFLVAPLTVLYSVLEWQQEEFRFQSVLFVIRTSVLVAAVVTLPIQYTIVIYSLVTSGIYLIFGIRLLLHTETSLRLVLADLVGEVQAALPIIALFLCFHFVLIGFVGMLWQWLAIALLSAVTIWLLLGYSRRVISVYQHSVKSSSEQVVES